MSRAKPVGELPMCPYCAKELVLVGKTLACNCTYWKRKQKRQAEAALRAGQAK